MAAEPPQKPVGMDERLRRTVLRIRVQQHYISNSYDDVLDAMDVPLASLCATSDQLATIVQRSGDVSRVEVVAESLVLILSRPLISIVIDYQGRFRRQHAKVFPVSGSQRDLDQLLANASGDWLQQHPSFRLCGNGDVLKFKIVRERPNKDEKSTISERETSPAAHSDVAACDPNTSGSRTVLLFVVLQQGRLKLHSCVSVDKNPQGSRRRCAPWPALQALIGADQRVDYYLSALYRSRLRLSMRLEDEPALFESVRAVQHSKMNVQASLLVDCRIRRCRMHRLLPKGVCETPEAESVGLQRPLQRIIARCSRRSKSKGVTELVVSSACDLPDSLKDRDKQPHFVPYVDDPDVDAPSPMDNREGQYICLKWSHDADRKIEHALSSATRKGGVTASSARWERPWRSPVTAVDELTQAQCSELRVDHPLASFLGGLRYTAADKIVVREIQLTGATRAMLVCYAHGNHRPHWALRSPTPNGDATEHSARSKRRYLRFWATFVDTSDTSSCSESRSGSSSEDSMVSTSSSDECPLASA